MVGGNESQSEIDSTTTISLRTSLTNSSSSSSSETLSYRLIPLKVDQSMDSLSEGEGAVPISPILASQLSPESNEPRLALIASSDSSTNTNPTVIVSGGVAYFISETINTNSSQRSNFLPRTTDTVLNQRIICSKDEKRRVTHNEVERRRRDKINTWICRLAKILPECPDIQAKNSNQVSKGVILSKACDYIEELKKQILTLSEKITATDSKRISQMSQEIEILKRENDFLKNDNVLLKAQLSQHGITIDS